MTKTSLFFLLTLVVGDVDLLASTLGREGDTSGLSLSKFTGGGSMVENVEAAARCGKKISSVFLPGLCYIQLQSIPTCHLLRT